jgi:hypothetical protein
MSAWLLRALLDKLSANLTNTRLEAISRIPAETSPFLLLGYEAVQCRRYDRHVAGWCIPS